VVYGCDVIFRPFLQSTNYITTSYLVCLRCFSRSKYGEFAVIYGDFADEYFEFCGAVVHCVCPHMPREFPLMLLIAEVFCYPQEYGEYRSDFRK
jgi:hypothetical protein